MDYKITKTETITVAEVGKNDYNDLTFKDTNGKDYKVSVKRKQHFENIIQPGAEVKLNWSEAYGKPFIFSAEQTGVHIVPEEGHLVKAAKEMGAVPVEPTPPQSKPTPDKMTPELWDAKESRTRKSIERQKALELTLNLVIADKIPLAEASTWVLKFERYLETGK